MGAGRMMSQQKSMEKTVANAVANALNNRPDDPPGGGGGGQRIPQGSNAGKNQADAIKKMVRI